MSTALIRLTCATRTIIVTATLHGNWAIHGQLDTDYSARSDAWVVTYVPSGLAVPRVWYSKSEAIAAAVALNIAIPEIADMSAETGNRIRQAIGAM